MRRFGWKIGHRLMRDESGNIAVLTALCMVMLLGFGSLVTDVGELYTMHQKMQSSVDAAALAGADDLLKGDQQAADTATAFGQTNDPDPSYNVEISSDHKMITVTADETTQLWLARVLQQNSAKLHVTSTGLLGTLTSGIGMVPISVPNQEFQYGQEVYLTSGAGDGSGGNYGFLDLSGDGANGLEYDIEHGYDFPLTVGEQVPTKTGVNAGPVATAIQYRINEAPNVAFDSVKSDSPRVIYLPVIDQLPSNGKKDVTILGFAAFFLEGLVGNGGQQQVEGRFIRMIRPGTIGTGSDYGTYSVKLTHS